MHEAENRGQEDPPDRMLRYVLATSSCPRLVGDFSYLPRATGIVYHNKQDESALVQVVDQKAIEAVSERLRDTKRSVRRDALSISWQSSGWQPV